MEQAIGILIVKFQSHNSEEKNNCLFKTDKSVVTLKGLTLRHTVNCFKTKISPNYTVAWESSSQNCTQGYRKECFQSSRDLRRFPICLKEKDSHTRSEGHACFLYLQPSFSRFNSLGLNLQFQFSSSKSLVSMFSFQFSLASLFTQLICTNSTTKFFQ